MKESDYDILDLIPQRSPIVMVDSFEGISDGVSYTELEVRPDNLFLCGGRLSECGVIEHIAQSAAAREGYASLNLGEKVRLGYIGAINDFSISALPLVGDTLRTSIRILQEVSGIILIGAECRIMTAVSGKDAQVGAGGACGTEIIAECRMKIFIADAGERTNGERA